MAIRAKRMILLDTCTLLWLVIDPEKLSTPAIHSIAKYAGNIFVSAITGFEIGIKAKNGLLQLPKAADLWFTSALTLHGIEVVPITAEIAFASVALPPIHRDPADRFIIATAQYYQYTLITPDQHIHAYPAMHVLW